MNRRDWNVPVCPWNYNAPAAQYSDARARGSVFGPVRYTGDLASTMSKAMCPLAVRAFCSVLLLLFLGGCRDPLSIRQKCFTNGNKFYEKGKYKEASILYRRALQLDAKYSEAWYRLGLTDLKMGDGRGAAAAFRRVVELDPANDAAALRLAELYVRAGLFVVEDSDR